VTTGPANQISGAATTRVLLVDDDPQVISGLGKILTSAGCVVTAVSGGHEAIALLESSTFDVIVSEIHLPQVDGLSLLRAIRGRDLDVPVVFLTGRPSLETAVEAIEHGAFKYFVKPVDGPALTAAVQRGAQLHRLARVRREAASALPGKPIGDLAGLEVRYASALDKLWIAMQPIVSWGRRSVYAYESLLRSDEPTMRNPLDFIEAAERLGRTVELGRTIRQRIADQMAAAPAAVQVFVNLHPLDLVDDELGSDAGALTRFASRVVLEVTERAALEQVPGLAAGIARLRQLGYRLALDDLGAGYAGLSSFALLEPEIAKVDMSLIRGIHGSPMKQKLFRSFTVLCRDLGTEIIAEGVEEAAERDCLNSLGGDLYQGYLFARPGRGFPEPAY
jgi:EAL domain-containing protein (putative c-di-GMP-specific phosphodiesterase class I)/CheY-like chemotaxis protein